MQLDEYTKLADIMYGHGEEFLSFLSGSYDPDKYPDAPPIQLCEMKCGCWIVGDGNNRVGLILKKNPQATLADIPKGMVATFQYGMWDDEMMDWANPFAKSFGAVMGKKCKKLPKPKDAIYGFIERNDDGEFFAASLSVKDGKSATTATGRTVQEAELQLKEKIKMITGLKTVSLVLMPMSPLEDHRCI